MCLVLDPAFNIVAQNDEHARTTLSAGKDAVGKNLFAVFPDNPNHSAADGVATVRASLLKVLKTRQEDVMPVIRYDVKGERGPYQARWWQIVNTPILDEDGYVRWISEPRPPKAGKTVQWTVLSGERRELGRAAGRRM